MEKPFVVFRAAILCCCGLFFCFAQEAAAQQPADTALFAAGAVPHLISRQFSFTEGPAADREGNVFFTEQPNNVIWKYGTDDSLRIFLTNAGRANGLSFDNEGNLLACADEQNELWQIDANGQVTVLLKDSGGKKFNGPNDVWVHPSGNIYFTDPYYQRPYWTRKAPELTVRAVYLLAKGKKKAVAVIKDLRQPNGIVGTPDGRWLYVADIEGKKTFRHQIKKNGRLGEGELFASMGSDGMAIDERGNVYLTGRGVTVFNPKGQQIAHIPVPEKWTANVAFGGKRRNRLFITASEGLYVMEMNVRGAE